MRLLIDLVEQNKLEEGKVLVHEILRGIVMEQLKELSSDILLDEESSGGGAGQPPDPADVAGTLEDPLIDPNMAREYFFKRFKHGEHEIILKKLGLGQNAPTISYVDDQRYEIFTTAQQAEKETIRYIDDGSFEKQQKQKEKEKEEEKPPAPAPKPAPAPAPAPKEESDETKNESVRIMRDILESNRPNVIDFDNGDSRVVTIEEAKNVLEIYDLLNNENRGKFVERLRSGETVYLEMLDFLMDRVRKGII